MKSSISLNGIWKFAPEHDQRPTNNHNVGTERPFYADERLDRRHWENVQVPGVWQRYSEKYSIYEGVCWFYREFELGEADDVALARLVFKGVNYRAEVYMNGSYAGEHESGYTEFSFDVSSLLRSGKNVLAVKVDNRPLITKWPNDWGYGVFGGIHRDVFIELYKGDFISDISIIPDYDTQRGCGVLRFAAKGSPDVRFAQIKLCDTVKRVDFKDGEASALLEFCEVEPWSPESPALYDIEIGDGRCVYEKHKIGFRHLSFKNRKILLNEKPITLKGICYVYDSPRLGLVMERAQLLEDLTLMKEANANFVRTHYPMSDDFYELCDELGLSVWIEPNVYCSKPHDDATDTVFKRAEYVDAAVSMTEEMVGAAKRFASVIIYGIGNECNTDHPEAYSFFETLSSAVRKDDGTRLVGYASLYGKVGSIADLVDVMGINSYYGWYGVMSYFDIIDRLESDDSSVKARRVKNIDKLHALIEKTETLTSPDTPILLTEFGADSIPGYNSCAHELWSEEYHAAVVYEYVMAQKEHDSVAGGSVFAFSDYSDPSKPMNGRWNGYNLKGMVTYDRQLKAPYFALKKAYSD